METMKDQFAELHSSHDNHMRTIESMQQTNKQQMMEWENEKNKLVSICVHPILYTNKTSWCKKCCGQESEKGYAEKDVKSTTVDGTKLFDNNDQAAKHYCCLLL